MSLPSPGWRIGLPLALLPAAVALHAPLQARGPDPLVRVLLQEATAVEVGVAGSTPLRVSDGRGRTLMELAPGRRLRLRTSGSGLRAELLPARGKAASPLRTVTLPEQTAWIDPAPGSGSLLVLNERRFRGRLQILPAGSRLRAINHIGLESYLASVVGSEMPASWPQAALRAQAVAARTYALRKLGSAAPFDLKATVASQVYRGVEAETSSTRQAVAGTRSQVLMHGPSLIDAVFHSSSGGATENSGEIWSRQLPYLVSVPDFDDHSPMRRWEKRFEPQDLGRAFPETGGVVAIDVLATSPSGRIRSARVRGPRGSLVVKGADLRKRLDLRSTLVSFRFEAAPAPGDPTLASAGGPVPLPVFSVAGSSRLAVAPAMVATGRGFGHGVGMSQWGAYGLARKGRSHEEILRHFYRGVDVRPYAFR
ncbi:MAG: SpoIID/LytB domain-containing protein [Synechococcaceae cyanobacterium]|nr:SpoIID/LytB domain-containing protein [Synechococcaceae cyanobacterium]